MKNKTKTKTKTAELYTPSGFLPCDIEMERECICDECAKDLSGLLHSLIHMRLDSIVILENLMTHYCKLSKEDRKLVKIDIIDGDAIVTGPEAWIDKLVELDVLDIFKDKKDHIEEILDKPI